MRTRRDLELIRAQNLIDAAIANKIPTQFGTNEELLEIGLLTIHFADVEASLAILCEALLFRRELRGFANTKPTIEKRFSEKLDLYRALVVAIGVLRSISTDTIESTILKANRMAEKRNQIIHGYLHAKAGGDVVFRNKAQELPADPISLRATNLEILQTHESIINALKHVCCFLLGTRSQRA
jgi:hypothetical protein